MNKIKTEHNKNHYAEFAPKRHEYARQQIELAGYKITYETEKLLQFTYKKSCVTIYTYAGVFFGATVADGRGIKALIEQVKK